MLETIDRIERIEGYVGATGLQRSQQRNQQVERAPHADSDAIFGTHALLCQEAGQLIGSRVQLQIRNVLISEYGGDRSGSALYLFFNKIMDPLMARIIRGWSGKPGRQALFHEAMKTLPRTISPNFPALRDGVEHIR